MICRPLVTVVVLSGLAIAVSGPRALAQDGGAAHFDKIERMVNVDLAEVGLPGAIAALRVTVNPGTKTPVHTHAKRTSVLVMVQGSLTEHRGDTVQEYKAGDVMTVAEGVTHWAENKGSVPVIYVELNTTATAPKDAR